MCITWPRWTNITEPVFYMPVFGQSIGILSSGFLIIPLSISPNSHHSHPWYPNVYLRPWTPPLIGMMVPGVWDTVRIPLLWEKRPGHVRLLPLTSDHQSWWVQMPGVKQAPAHQQPSGLISMSSLINWYLIIIISRCGQDSMELGNGSIQRQATGLDA